MMPHPTTLSMVRSVIEKGSMLVDRHARFFNNPASPIEAKLHAFPPCSCLLVSMGTWISSQKSLGGAELLSQTPPSPREQPMVLSTSSSKLVREAVHAHLRVMISIPLTTTHTLPQTAV